jgi:general secretion pathway protein D
MKTQQIKMQTCIALLLGFTLFAPTELRAQQGFGGFGGFGGGGANRGNTTTTPSQQYNANGAVGNATISIDPDTHNLTIIADEDTTKYIAQVVTNLDRPQPQVLIKVVFMELTRNDSLDIGIEGAFGKQISGGTNNPLSAVAANAFGASSLGTIFSQTNLNAFGQPIGNFAPVPPGAGLYQVLGTDFQATLRAIATAGKAELLSRPSVLARNNQPATIVVGQSVPLITSVSFSALGNQYNNVSYQNVGIILKVTPYITSEGLVQMIVQPSTSAIDPTLTIPIAVGVNAPVIDTRSADTVVLTPDGQTVVIGGLMQKSKTSSESKIPFLGDIPWLGNLFKRKTNAGSKTELLIFLTPHVIQAPSQLAALSDKEKHNTLTPKSYSEQELDRFLEKMPEKKPAKDNSN